MLNYVFNVKCKLLFSDIVSEGTVKQRIKSLVDTTQVHNEQQMK